MLKFAPASGGLALWVHHHDLATDGTEDGGGDEADDGLGARRARRLAAHSATHPATDQDAAIFTDGRTVFYRPAFDELPLAEQTASVAHQVLHIALRHVPRERALRQQLGDVDAQLFNLCADAIVNSALAPLRWLQLPARAVRLEDVLANVLGVEARADTALAEWDVERLYRAIDDRRPPASNRASTRSAGRSDGSGQRPDGPRAARLRTLGAGTAQDLKPGAGDADSPETEAEATRDWGERLLRAQAGDGPYSMLRGLLADLPRVRTPWEQVLRTQFTRALSQQPGISWSRPTRSWIANQGRAGPGRRLPWEPGMTASRNVPRVVLVLDVSGSIDDALLARFTREVQALTRRLEAALVLVIGDTLVHEVRHCAPGQVDLSGLAFARGGGTDFTPLLAEAAKHRPDLIVVLTDLDGPARSLPRCPVLWAVPEADARAEAPFGRVLVLR